MGIKGACSEQKVGLLGVKRPFAWSKKASYLLQKGIGNGFPMGAVLISPKFTPVYGQLGTTFGGNHLACAAAIAVLDVMKEENLVKNAATVGTHLMESLKAAQLPHVVDIRGRGLMIGIELDIPYKDVRNRLLHKEHCFTGCSGTNVLRLLPPLCLSISQADQFVDKLERVLRSCQA